MPSSTNASCTNPLVVADPRIRFYAGAPLVNADGHALGTICVVDRIPRTLTKAQRAALEALRRQVMAQLELRRNLDELSAALRERDRAEDEQQRLVGELQTSLAHVQKLSALLPFCSACQLNMVIADAAAIATVSEGVMQVLADRGWAEGKRMAVELALQEALANAIRHGCQDDPGKQSAGCVQNLRRIRRVDRRRDPVPGSTSHRARPHRRAERVQVERPRDLPDQPAHGRSALPRWRPRNPDARATTCASRDRRDWLTGASPNNRTRAAAEALSSRCAA